VRVIRPLLDLGRDEIETHLRDHGIPFRTDPTNLDGSNLRSVVRTRLLPALEAAVPRLRERLAALADRARPVVWPEGVGASAEGALRATLLRRLPADGPPVDRAAVRRVARRLRAGRGRADLGGGWSAEVLGEDLRVRPPTAEPPPAFAEAPLPCPGAVRLPDGTEIRARPGPAERGDGPEEVLDADAAPPPYSVRTAREGDRFHPLGMPSETSLFRFLMARRVPREERPRTPVVLAAGTVVLVVGHRIAEPAKVRGATRRTVAIREGR